VEKRLLLKKLSWEAKNSCQSQVQINFY